MDCELTKNMPFGAFIVFVGSLVIFMYILIDDYTKTKEGARNKEDILWIYIFLFMLLSCVVISGMCIVRNNNIIGNSKLGKNITKNISNKLESFKTLLPSFIGKRRF
jgi:NADH:ubiquinone oxidoreductase subunit 6 (subunit J)